MALIDESSLASTVDALSGVWFSGGKPAQPEREQAARFIAGRQGLPGGYRGLFAPLDSEPGNQLTLFTGEVTTHASARHILGEEAYRALLLLGIDSRPVQTALERASVQIGPLLRKPDSRGPGMYCCGKCSVAVWRAIMAGGYGGDRRFVEAGVKTLSAHRDGQGRWRVFPFWYTVLALAEAEGKVAQAELRYVAPVLERVLKRKPVDQVYAARRHVLAERALARC